MRLHCADVGRGPVVVLLHGFPFDGRMWEAQHEALAASYRLVIPDLRGFGQSPAPVGDVSAIDAMADDVLETLDALGIAEPVVLGGLSMGGYVALSIAARAPDRLRGLMLIDTKAAGDTADAAAGRRETADKVERIGSTDAVVEGMLGKLFATLTWERRPEVVGQIETMMRQAPPRVVAATLRGLGARPDRTADLAGIAVSTLVVVGDQDAITPPEEARRMVRDLPDARLAEIPDAGHLAPVENPDEVNRVLLDYLATLDQVEG